MIITNCQKCGKEIETTPERIKKGRGKFCSKKCLALSRPKGRQNPLFGIKRKENIIKIIRQKRNGKKPTLGKHWKISENKRINMARKNHWIKNNNPSWIDGRSRERGYNVDWKRGLRRSIRERDNYICQICKNPQGDEALSIHHIDYNKENCDPKNLITLCRGCHSKTNFNKEKWIEFFYKNALLKNMLI